MDYCSRYGLEFNPFLKNSKEIPIKTHEYNEVLFRLDSLSKTRGFGLVTGSPGRGKTTAIRSWARALNPSPLQGCLFQSVHPDRPGLL